MKGAIASQCSVSIAIFGSGFVGWVTGTCFAAAGVEVIGVDEDPDPAKLARLLQGECPLYEPGLQALMQEAIAAGRLRFSGDAAAAIGSAPSCSSPWVRPPMKTARSPDTSSVVGVMTTGLQCANQARSAAGG